MTELLKTSSRLEGRFRQGAWPVANLMAVCISPIALTDLQGDIIHVNRAFCQRWGYQSEAEVITRPLSSVVSIDGTAEAVADLAAVEWRQSESTAIGADGVTFAVELAAGIIRDAAGSPLACMVSVNDISERRQLEKEISESFREFICLYTVGSIAERPNTTLAGLFQETAELLPVSFRYPDITAARISFHGENYCTPDYRPCDCGLRAPLKDNDRIVGEIEVCYLELRPEQDEGPFSRKERLLVEAVAARLERIVELKQSRQALQISEARLREQNWKLTVLNEVSGALNRSLNLDDVLKRVLDTLSRNLGLRGVAIYLNDGETGEPVLAARRGSTAGMLRRVSRQSPAGDLNRRVLVNRNIVISGRPANAPKRPIISVPLWAGGNAIGVMHIVAGAKALDDGTLDLLDALSRQVGVRMENVRLVAQMKQSSVTDELTGLYNRRQFYRMLENEADRARRYRHSTSLAMIDLDGFKEVNDTYGHASGDRVLRDFAELLRASLRQSDIPFRQGGDEFAIIFTQTDAITARRIVMRLRQRWLALIVESYSAMKEKLDFSTGIGQFPENGDTAEKLVAISDAALYMSKFSGKGKTTLASGMNKLAQDFMEGTSGQQIYALASTVDAKDACTYGHSERVATLSVALGEAVGLSRTELMDLKAAALLHDIGKVGIPDAILSKKGKLTEAEYERIKRHPDDGAKIVGFVRELAGLVPAIRHHHERWDGGGYPEGLYRNQIPLPARIIAVADSYDAITSQRSYKEALSGEAASREIAAGSGSQFDPTLAEAFLKVIGNLKVSDKSKKKS